MNNLLWKIALVVAPITTVAFFAPFVISFITSFTRMSALEAGRNDTVQARAVDFHKDQPSIKNINPIQIDSIDYSFQVNGQTYTNSVLGSDKVGDMLPVLYLKEDPNINVPARANISEQKVFNGLAAVLIFFAGIGLTLLIAKILWRKVASNTRGDKRNGKLK